MDVDPRADGYTDVTRPLPLPDGSVDAIFCEEVIEHVSLADGRRLLRECLRVLRPGGVLRVTTPDLGYFAGRAADAGDNGNEINGIFYGHGHRHLYTRLALETECRAAGFVAVRWSRHRDPTSRLGRFDSHPERFGHPPEWSQHLEVEKAS